ncbi:hypothetical protein BpHYR1_049955 [Brachionus plicatilis]|uniref:Uncharacterized protein n=1 Tax=Brachionus plicatilis TaxID=10195 RepID=A0A3M7P9S2_BRAPC|nr:hypothetical protein BpHYR1_049955 [Brachionus plicatilis]
MILLAWIYFLSLVLANGLIMEDMLKNTAVTTNKDKEMYLKLALKHGEYYGYDYDYGYYGSSYRCDPHDYYCNNYGYDFGDSYRKLVTITLGTMSRLGLFHTELIPSKP